MFEEIDPAADRAIVAELRQIVADHPDAPVILGIAGGSPDPRLDFRLAAAMAVGLDALMSR